MCPLSKIKKKRGNQDFRHVSDTIIPATFTEDMTNHNMSRINTVNIEDLMSSK